MDNSVLQRNSQLYDIISNHYNSKINYKINEIGTICNNNDSKTNINTNKLF